MVYVFWHIFWSRIGQFASVHVAIVLLCFFVRYWRSEGPEWASWMSSPSLWMAFRISLVIASLKCGNFRKQVLESVRFPCSYIFFMVYV